MMHLFTGFPFYSVIFIFLSFTLAGTFLGGVMYYLKRSRSEKDTGEKSPSFFSISRESVPKKATLEGRIFRLAHKSKGRITVSDVVIETGLRVEEAESLMDSMVDNSHVSLEVGSNGMLTYEFPEILNRVRD